MAKLLLVDDHEELRDLQAEYLEQAGHEVIKASNGLEAIILLQHESFDLVITDVVMPRKQGMEVILYVHENCSETPIIAVSGGGRVGAEDYLSIARTMGAQATLLKPFSPSALAAEVEKLLATH